MADACMNIAVCVVVGCLAYALIQGVMWIAALASWPVLIAVALVLVFLVVVSG
jgi:hypothetical protein